MIAYHHLYCLLELDQCFLKQMIFNDVLYTATGTTIIMSAHAAFYLQSKTFSYAVISFLANAVHLIIYL